MARPVTIDEAKLLKVARELFLKRGASTTTAEVAKKLGIAQGSIFRRYKTKQELFRAAMLSQELPWVTSLRSVTEAKGLKEALVESGRELASFYRKALPLMLMGWSNRGTLGSSASLKRLSQPPRASAQMIDFFREQVKLGRVRTAAPEILLSAYMGPLVAYVLTETLRGSHPVPFERFVNEVVEVLWRGISPGRAA